MKPLLILAVGLIAGYFYGFDDAQSHKVPLQRRIAAQVASRAGGASRELVSGDVDAQMQSAERR